MWILVHCSLVDFGRLKIEYEGFLLLYGWLAIWLASHFLDSNLSAWEHK